MVQELQKLHNNLQNSGNQSDNSAKQIEIDGMIEGKKVVKKVDIESESDCDSEVIQVKQENDIKEEVSTAVKNLESDIDTVECNTDSRENSLQCIT